MNPRLVTALAVALAIAALSYTFGVRNQPAGLSDEARTEIESMLADKLASAAVEVDAGEPETLVSALNDENLTEIKALIRSHLVSNPDIITDAIDALQAREQQAEQAALVGVIEDNAANIFASERQVVLGNPDGDTTLVEFFDYNCSFCRRAMSDLQQLLENDPQLRVVLKEFPVLGEGSVEAARVSIALHMTDPSKYEQFHFTLMSERGQVDGATAMAIAEEIGVSPNDLQLLLDTGEVDATINEVYEIAGYLNLSGTPSYVTPKEVVVGAVGYEALRTKIAEARAN